MINKILNILGSFKTELSASEIAERAEIHNPKFLETFLISLENLELSPILCTLIFEPLKNCNCANKGLTFCKCERKLIGRKWSLSFEGQEFVSGERPHLMEKWNLLSEKNEAKMVW